MSVRRREISLVFLFLFLFLISNVWSITKDDIVKFVNKAVNYCHKVGKEKCLKDFTYSPEWKRGSLYIFALKGPRGALASVQLQKLGFKNVYNLKDKNGKYFIKEMIEVVKKKGEGWVLYSWFDRTTKRIRPKISFVKKVDNTFFVGAGMYK